MKREFKNITIGIKKVGADDLQQYVIKDLNSYNKVIKEWNFEHNLFDGYYEVKIINYGYTGVLVDSDLYDFLLLCEEYQNIQPQEILNLLMWDTAKDVNEYLRTEEIFDNWWNGID